jgi:hypothetical protein
VTQPNISLPTIHLAWTCHASRPPIDEHTWLTQGRIVGIDGTCYTDNGHIIRHPSPLHRWQDRARAIFSNPHRPAPETP